MLKWNLLLVNKQKMKEMTNLVKKHQLTGLLQAGLLLKFFVPALCMSSERSYWRLVIGQKISMVMVPPLTVEVLQEKQL